ncbi:RNA recognition motif domain-containing protein, partial [Salmonella sp. s51933]|uniref:RNA recognition motif domain-containing protein n=1 Tax=Salmonella sp. s51933 TaxID=3160127 RepID=UPI0037542157
MSDDAKVHVGNLSYDASEDEIRDTFEKYGTVDEVCVITDRETGKGRGFAFVTFQNADHAAESMNALNKTDLCGRSITVNKARPRDGGSRGGYRGGGGGGGSYDY